MDFNLTDERRMLQETLQRFLHEKYSHESRRQILASGKVYDAELFAEMAELGVLAALFTEDAGGFGGAGFDISIVFEELGRAGVIEPVLGSAVLAGSLLAELGNEAQLGLLEKVMDGSTILGFAHGEPDSRYDLNCVAVSAVSGECDKSTEKSSPDPSRATFLQNVWAKEGELVRQGTGLSQARLPLWQRGNEGDLAFNDSSTKDGQIVLNGTKTHVINGTQSDLLLVSARESGDPYDEAGISLFLIPIDTPGVDCKGHLNIDGTAAATITFTDVQLDETARLGTADSAFTSIETATARAILAVCAEAVGAMETAKHLTGEYLRERQQFGMPIGKFQALQHRMADMLIEIEQARSAVVNLAGNLNQPRDIRERYVSAAKNLVGRVGTLVAEECIQLHGGIGMTEEYALSHFARRLIMIDHQFGDVDHHLERFMALNNGQVA